MSMFVQLLFCYHFTGLEAHLYGGDIVLTPEQQATLEATSNQNDPFSPQNAVVRDQQFLWRNGIVYYVLDDSLSKHNNYYKFKFI